MFYRSLPRVMDNTAPFDQMILPVRPQSQTRPWHQPTNQWHSQRTQHTKGDFFSGPLQNGIDIYALVDSWRSYKEDTTNLQLATNPVTALNAAAQPFHPAQNGPYYKPYEPLRSVHHYARYPTYRVDKPYRTSDGSKERNVIEQAKRKTPKAQAPGPITNFAKRYPVRANRTQADQPLPSVEGNELADYFNTVNQVLMNPNARKQRIPTPQRKTPRQTASPAPPSSTEAYRSQALREPNVLAKAKKLLVILDLNGTLLYRAQTKDASGSRKVHMRPGVTPLLEYLFSNHVVMIYTSAMPQSANDMISQFIHPTHRKELAALWARDKLDLNKGQYNAKVQVYKKLDKIWNDKGIQATAGSGNRWNQSNTVLIDDSKLKALAQPHNLIQVAEYTKEDDPARGKGKASKLQRHKVQIDMLKQLELKLEALKFQENVSQLIRKWQVGETSVPKAPGQEVSVEENVDQSQLRQDAEVNDSECEAHGREQLPTPVSIGEGDAVDCPIEIGSDEDEDSEGGVIFSHASVVQRKPASVQPIYIPGLEMLKEEEEHRHQEETQSRESSVDETVFRDLLGESSKRG